MNYDLIIYDCDGTLVDTDFPVNQALIDTLQTHGYTQFDVDWIHRECFGFSLPKLFERMGEVIGHTLPQSIEAEYQLLVPGHLARSVKPDDEQINAITSLDKILKQCVASNGLKGNVIASIKAAGLSDVLPDQHIFVSAQVERPKPFPDLFLYAAKTMGASYPLVIEDSVLGVQAAVAAGMTAFGYIAFARDKNTARKSLSAAGASQIFENWTDISNAIRIG